MNDRKGETSTTRQCAAHHHRRNSGVVHRLGDGSGRSPDCRAAGKNQDANAIEQSGSLVRTWAEYGDAVDGNTYSCPPDDPTDLPDRVDNLSPYILRIHRLKRRKIAHRPVLFSRGINSLRNKSLRATPHRRVYWPSCRKKPKSTHRRKLCSREISQLAKKKFVHDDSRCPESQPPKMVPTRCAESGWRRVHTVL